MYNEIFESDIKPLLAQRRMLRKVSPFVLIGLVFFALWFCQMTVAIASLPVVVNILR